MSTRKPCAAGKPCARISGTLSPNEIMNTISEKCGVVAETFKKKGEHYVFFVPHAKDSLEGAIHYGKWVPENALESQYFLEGYYFIDNNGNTSTVVTNIITTYSASQGKTSAQLYSKDNNAYKYIEQKEQELSEHSSGGKDNATGNIINPFFDTYGAPIRVGFGHTHPNLSCFFSSVDKTSVFAAAGEPWITMVADPRREEILVAVGAELTPAIVIMFKPNNNQISVSEEISNSPTESNSEDIVAFLALIEDCINTGASLKLNLKGRFPGKIRFKGVFVKPKTKR